MCDRDPISSSSSSFIGRGDLTPDRLSGAARSSPANVPEPAGIIFGGQCCLKHTSIIVCLPALLPAECPLSVAEPVCQLCDCLSPEPQGACCFYCLLLHVSSCCQFFAIEVPLVEVISSGAGCNTSCTKIREQRVTEPRAYI